jgi:hypothetical protein
MSVSIARVNYRYVLGGLPSGVTAMLMFWPPSPLIYTLVTLLLAVTITEALAAITTHVDLTTV